jgi:hypothetical protein
MDVAFYKFLKSASPFGSRRIARKEPPIATGQEIGWALQPRLDVVMKRKIILLQIEPRLLYYRGTQRGEE